jgi:hypothetical protein
MTKSRIFSIILLVALLTSSWHCSTPLEEVDPEGEDFSFTVLSDVQQGYGIFSQLARWISELDATPLACFVCGDIMLRSANEAEWLNFWRYAGPITDKMPLFIARGNHEGNDPASESVFRQQCRITGEHFYSSYTCDRAYFIILDTEVEGEESSITGDQLQWLRSELDSASVDDKIFHIFILMHHPLFPQGFHNGTDLENAEELHALFLENPKIRTVFAGHDHIFNRYRRDGINYITTGGGGGSLNHGYGGEYHHFLKVSVFNDPVRINIKSIGLFNEVIEDFDI